MNNKTNTVLRKKRRRKRGRLDRSCLICWGLIPLAMIIFLVLDGLGFYPFNTERLLVIGVCVLVILIPFFSEITITNISLKKEAKHKENPKL